MAEHKITLKWFKGDVPFTYDAYPRNHSITFKDGAPVMFSAAATYRGDPSKGDPEDMLVAALSSCHMLSFLAICAKKRIAVEAYDDDATGWLENAPFENGPGKLWMTRVVLRPRIRADATAEILNEIHHLAHEACFIANSVRTQVTVEPR
jgi:organic hydroperoxide reductase OsmC/OhrA